MMCIMAMTQIQIDAHFVVSSFECDYVFDFCE